MGVGASKDFSALITDKMPNLDMIEKAQCFPLYWYEERKHNSPTLFDSMAGPTSSSYIRRDGISDFILERARSMYGNITSKEDVFYYVYGILHSPKYREIYAADLKKVLPRLPLVENSTDFWKFVKTGRELAELHLNYENCGIPYSVTITGTDENADYEVVKMRFPKKGKTDTIIYNQHITIENIPAKAYEYVVNGKSAIEWIMERYQITTHKASGIVNNPNHWATEHDDPKYILRLLLSIINVSLRTVEIVEKLPDVEFEE